MGTVGTRRHQRTRGEMSVATLAVAGAAAVAPRRPQQRRRHGGGDVAHTTWRRPGGSAFGEGRRGIGGEVALVPYDHQYGVRCCATPGSDIGLGPLAGVYDAVGAWLVEHPAPQWVVNSPLKTRATEILAGSSYDPEQSVAEVKRLIASDDVVARVLPHNVIHRSSYHGFFFRDSDGFSRVEER